VYRGEEWVMAIGQAQNQVEVQMERVEYRES
jgi:hypothetical protein